MRLPSLRFWRFTPEQTEEARDHLAKAAELDAKADRLIARERHLIRVNNFGPKVAAALREGRP